MQMPGSAPTQRWVGAGWLDIAKADADATSHFELTNRCQRAVGALDIIHTGRIAGLIPGRQVGARRGAAGDELHAPISWVEGRAHLARHLADALQLRQELGRSGSVQPA